MSDVKHSEERVEAYQRRGDVLREVDAYLERTGTPPTRLGFHAVRNGAFVTSLRQDLKRLDELRARRVRECIAKFPDGIPADAPLEPVNPKREETRPLEDRMDETSQILIARRMVPKVFYLVGQDWQAFLATRAPVVAGELAFGGTPVREGKGKARSRLYSTSGKTVGVPAR